MQDMCLCRALNAKYAIRAAFTIFNPTRAPARIATKTKEFTASAWRHSHALNATPFPKKRLQWFLKTDASNAITRFLKKARCPIYSAINAINPMDR